MKASHDETPSWISERESACGMAWLEWITTSFAGLSQIQRMKALMGARRGATESSNRASVRHLSERAVNTPEEFACKVNSSARLHIGSP